MPFFSISASEFVEMIVGVGAGWVRDLFDQAKQVAPSIIFIDELDAIGRARGRASVGGSDEQEQTLNQILTEMDGFTGDEGVVVLAATNRADVLDPALLRPGRFDRRVTISRRTGRAAADPAVHARSVPLAASVDLDALAAATPGMVGADLANLVNEAALLAARRNRDRVTMPDFSDALEKSPRHRPRHRPVAGERERTAFHESGHALLGMLTPGATRSARSRSSPGAGPGRHLPGAQSDRYGYSEAYLRGRITGALGGRAAEKVVYGDVTTGAENDLEHASDIARQMAGRWGMSPAIGPVSVLPHRNQEHPTASTVSPRHQGTGGHRSPPDHRGLLRAAVPPCAATATSSAGWPTPCWRARRLMRTTLTPRPASTAAPPPPRSMPRSPGVRPPAPRQPRTRQPPLAQGLTVIRVRVARLGDCVLSIAHQLGEQVTQSGHDVVGG